MKKFLTSRSGLLLVLLLIFNGAFAQKAKEEAHSGIDTSDCLVFTGKLDATMKNAEGEYTIKLIKDNRVVEQQTIKIKKSFDVILKRNFFYTIKIEKEGFIPRYFSISTEIPAKVEVEDLFKFNFETNLISADLYHHFDDDDMDFPVALVSYGKKCDCFEYDEKYTASLIQRILNQMFYGSGK